MLNIKDNFITKNIEIAIIFVMTLLWIIIYLINDKLLSVDLYVNGLLLIILFLMLLNRQESKKYFYIAYIFIVLSVLVTLFQISVLMSAFSSMAVGLLGIGLINQLFFKPRTK